jgi:hypothetical protein
MIWETLKNVVFILTLRCDQASRLISHSQETPLNRAEQLALSFHLLICRVCRKYKRQLKLMRDVLGRLAEPGLYSSMASSLLDQAQSRALRERMSKKLRENMDSK